MFEKIALFGVLRDAGLHAEPCEKVIQRLLFGRVLRVEEAALEAAQVERLRDVFQAEEIVAREETLRKEIAAIIKEIEVAE